jgi:hypothetical protein
MVYPVHGRRHKEYPPDGFEPPWNLQTAVMELDTKYHCAFKYQHPQVIRTEKKYYAYLDNGRYGKFPDMKSGRCGDVHVQIGVMNTVKPPQKRHLVIQEMPDIQHEIHEGYCGKNLEPYRAFNHIEYS